MTRDPLPSWADGAVKSALLGFVARVTQGPDRVPVADRIAVFDNDGTLWAEKPWYAQLAFVADRILQMAPERPEWERMQPYRAVLENDLKALAASGKKGVMELFAATHAGMSTDEFDLLARGWLAQARHPRTGRAYTDMVYQPMLELLALLHDRDFRCYVVSAGGVDFMRCFCAEVYGIPPERVIGSSTCTALETSGEGMRIIKRPDLEVLNDHEAKPVSINRVIGRRPILAAGNSDGDQAMLQWVTTGPGPTFGMLVHHTDAGREWAYDRESHIGRLDAALDAAPLFGWAVADMKRDWLRVFPGDGGRS